MKKYREKPARASLAVVDDDDLIKDVTGLKTFIEKLTTDEATLINCETGGFVTPQRTALADRTRD